MGSDLYLGRVLREQRRTPGWRELTAMVPDPEFTEWGWALGVPDEAIDALINWEALWAAVAARVQAVGADGMAALTRSMFFNPELLAALAAGTPEAITRTDDISYTIYSAVTQGMLAELLPDRFSALEVAVVDIEAATYHSDAGFPDPDDYYDHPQKCFCLRLLSEADHESWDSSLLYKHFNRHGNDAWAKHDFMGGEDEVDGIILNVERLRVLDLEVDKPAFWEAHASEWWAPKLQSYLKTPSDNQPFQAVTFRITAPSAWLRPLTGDRFRSRAY